MATIDDVIDTLGPDQSWELLGRVKMRRYIQRGYSTVPHCPISHAAEVRCGVAYDCGSYHPAGAELHLTFDQIMSIVGAADGRSNHDPELRARMLAKCGLKERA